jgi:ubiquitin carboxyl-terminal hydrolase 8
LRTAATAFEQAKILADGDDSDKAYVQYLRASEITINLIPHHPEYPTIQTRSPELYKEFAALMMVRSPAPLNY